VIDTDSLSLEGVSEQGDTTVAGRSLLLGARNLLFSAKCGFYGIRNALASDTRRLTSEMTWVEPDEIEYVTRYVDGLDFGPDPMGIGIGAFDTFGRTGAVVSGEWDRPEIEFSSLPIYRGLAERIEDGTQWENTTFFEVHRNNIDRGNTPWGCTTEAELRDRCEYVENLWRRIDRQGYKSQRELGKYPVDEINVNVGRDGELLFNDGRHRLATAKILGVEKVPVRILVVHEEFDGDFYR